MKLNKAQPAVLRFQFLESANPVKFEPATFVAPLMVWGLGRCDGSDGLAHRPNL